MSFWQSDLGELSGKAEDAFTKIFKVIPDNTLALAAIKSFVLAKNQSTGTQFYNVNWMITSGEFKGQSVFQKIHAFDSDAKKKHRSLNMLKYLYELFGIKPLSANAPSDSELKVFEGKIAGIKIQEWSAPKQDGSGMMEGNYVSEVHERSGFKEETGVKLEVTHTTNSGLESAFSRNVPRLSDPLDDEIPF